MVNFGRHRFRHLFSLKVAGAFFLVLTIAGLLGEAVFGPEPGLILVVALAASVLLAAVVEYHNRMKAMVVEQSANVYAQTEALVALLQLLKVRHPLPPMRNWAISPDAARLIVGLVLERKPRLVVELGSGVSTLLSGYCLEQVGGGRVVSLDNDEGYSRTTEANIVHHGLQDWAGVVHAPLRPVSIKGKEWLWYDLAAALPLPGPIDLLIVDGPPCTVQPSARYPALPLLVEHLSDQAVVIMDDAGRDEEKQIIEEWQKEFAIAEVVHVATEKGATVLYLKKE